MAQPTTAAGQASAPTDAAAAPAIVRGESQAEPLLAVRPLGPGDLGLVLSSWLRSVRHGSHVAWGVPSQVFFPSHERVVKAILARPGVVGVAACLVDDPNVVVAWAVCEPGLRCVHFAYTKEAWRGAGLASRLVVAAGLPQDGQPVFASHATGKMTTPGALFERRGVTFNPYLAHPSPT